eukprot:11029169-Ditylum_brightwellii.AAC.1
MWRLYTDIPEEYMTDPVPPSSCKVSTNLDKELICSIEGPKIVKYWTHHYTFPEGAVTQINWPAIEKAWSNQNFFQHKWATKWAAEKIPTGSKMEDWKAWDNATCPQQCGKELEDPEHIILCPKVNQLWRNIQQVILMWGAKNAAASCLMEAFVQGLHQWHERDTHSLPPPETSLQSLLRHSRNNHK